MRNLFLIFLTLTAVGCASYFKKKSCEEINWFEHGKQVALRGEWLNSDATINECRKVEAEIQESQLDLGFKSGREKYCGLEQVYQLGKQGDFFSREFCEGPQITDLINSHQKGVRDYCAKSNGQNAGSSGKKYQNICPKDLEIQFLSEYKKGRKKYVESMIQVRQADLAQFQNEISSKRKDLSYQQGRISTMNSELQSLQAQKNMIRPGDTHLTSFLDSRISSLTSDLNQARSESYSLEREVRDLETKREAASNSLKSFKAELPSLD